MNERLGWAIGTGLAVAAIGLSGQVLPSEEVATEPITVQVSQTAVCPAIAAAAGTGTAAVSVREGAVTVQLLEAGSSRRAVPTGQVLLVPKPGGPLQVDLAAGSVGGASVVTRDLVGLERGLSASACDGPDTAAWFVGVESTDVVATDIYLTNTDAGPAAVDLAFHGATGRIPVPGSRSVSVAPGETRRVALGPLVKSTDPISVQVSASQGRVAAAARSRAYVEGQETGAGVEFVPQSVAPRTDIVVPAVPGGAGPRTLVVANPGARSAEVALEMLTPDGPRVLETFQTVTVAGESTLTFPIDSLFHGEGGALRLTSTLPVTAGLVAPSATAGGDLGLVGSSRPFSGVAELPLMLDQVAATLHLANPGEAASATVTFLDATGAELEQHAVELAAGSWLALDVPSEPTLVVRVETAGQLAGAVELTSPTGGEMLGIATVPLSGGQGAGAPVQPRREPGYGSRS